MTQFPPSEPAYAPMVKPHRAGMILAFGLVGLLVCLTFAIVAWVMGAGDLREMRAGRMDPSGMGMTEAGKIIGMVAIILYCLGFLLWLFIVVIFAGAGLAGAASGGRGP